MIDELTPDEYQAWKDEHPGSSLWECEVSSIGVMLVNDSNLPQCHRCGTVCGVGWDRILGLFYHNPLTVGHWPDGVSEKVVRGCGAYFNGYGRLISDKQVTNLMWNAGRSFVREWKLLW